MSGWKPAAIGSATYMCGASDRATMGPSSRLSPMRRRARLHISGGSQDSMSFRISRLKSKAAAKSGGKDRRQPPRRERRYHSHRRGHRYRRPAVIAETPSRPMTNAPRPTDRVRPRHRRRGRCPIFDGKRSRHESRAVAAKPSCPTSMPPAKPSPRRQGLVDGLDASGGRPGAEKLPTVLGGPQRLPERAGIEAWKIARDIVVIEPSRSLD